MTMQWQDVVLAIGTWIFALALLPSLFSKNKPSKWTSLMTAVPLSSFVVCYFTLGLWITGISISVSSLLWWVLFYQGVRK